MNTSTACAWCHQQKHQIILSDRVTHGICMPCLIRMCDELNMREAMTIPRAPYVKRDRVLVEWCALVVVFAVLMAYLATWI